MNRVFLFSNNSIKRLKLRSKSYIPLTSLLALAACSSGSGSETTLPVLPPPTPDFIEDPVGTFTARDNNPRTLNQSGSTIDLTVYGGENDDTITTGSGNDSIEGKGGDDTISAGSGDDNVYGGTGNDTIASESGENFVSGGNGDDIITTGDGPDLVWAGNGSDDVNTGAGDDSILMIGNNAGDQFSDSLIIQFGDQTFNLTDILNLLDVIDNSATEITDNEVINGGDGSDELIIYGDADLTSVDVTNIEKIWVNGQVTLTVGQFAALESVEGNDGAEIIVGASNSSVSVDLSVLDVEGLSLLTFNDDVTVLATSADDFAGIGSITSSGAITVNLSSASSLSVSDITGTLAATTIIVGDGVELIVDTVPAEGLDLSGSGTVTLSDAILNDPAALAGLIIDDELGETISGTAGDDTLFGNGGDDSINGLQGNDTLTGGSGSDVFVFDTDWGQDRITDFENGLDLIDLRGSSLVFADLIITDQDGNTIITDSNGNTITLDGISSSEITADDFLF